MVTSEHVAGEHSGETVLALVAHAHTGETVSMLEVKRRDRIALAGGSDAERAALVRALAGLEPPVVSPTDGGPWYGRVLLQGQDLTWALPRARRTLWSRIGVVFQRGGLWTGRSIAYNLTLPSKVHRLDRAEGWQGRFDELVERLDLEAYLHRDVVDVALPVRRRAALARALLIEPAVLLFDEPQLGLSTADRLRILGVLESHRDRGMAVIYCDADGDLTPFLVDTFYELSRGRLVRGFFAPADPRPRGGESPLEQAVPRAARPGQPTHRFRRTHRRAH